jgi:hypothetical protein
LERWRCFCGVFRTFGGYIKNGIFTFCRFYAKTGQLMFILVNFLETAENGFIKMNGFRVFWAKVDENEWVLGKSKIATKKLKRHKKREKIEHG